MNDASLLALVGSLGVSRQEAGDVAVMRAQQFGCDRVASDCAACRRRDCVDAVGDVLGGLISIVLAHAAREDPLLRRVGAPWADRHVEAHAGLAEALCTLTGLFVQSPAQAKANLAQLAEHFLAHDVVSAANESPVVAFSS